MLCHFTLLVGDICIVSNDIGSSVVFIISKVIVANNVDLDIQHPLVLDRRNIGKRAHYFIRETFVQARLNRSDGIVHVCFHQFE